MTTCEECGAGVADAARHDAWHGEMQDKLNDVQATADDALDRAEQAQNTLYQNGIEV